MFSHRVRQAMNRWGKVIGTLFVIGTIGTQPGCYSMTSGSRVERADVERIVRGKTTRAEVLKMFGPPTRATIAPDGREALSWEYSKASAQAFVFVNSARMEDTGLTVFLTQQGVVDDYMYTAGAR